MKKMLVSDFDSTLYFNGYISEEDKDAIKRFSQDNIFVIASGRTYYSFYCDNDGIEPNYLIADYGSLIFKEHENIYHQPIDNDLSRKTIDIITKYISIDNIYPSHIKEDSVDVSEKEINKIRVSISENELKNKIINDINQQLDGKVKCYSAILFGKPAMEIVSVENNKSKAIDIIAKLEGIAKENIYTIGDGPNDMEMIRDYKGYAVKNAVNELKQISVSEVDSVADLIKLIE